MIASSKRIQGLPNVDHYAPNVRVSVEGKKLEAPAQSNVIELEVNMHRDALASFQISFSNWDESVADFPKFKYSDSKTFSLGADVKIEMGYADDLVTMMKGTINTLSANFPQSGAPKFLIGGNDELFKLCESRPKKGDKLIFENKTDWQVAQYIADKNGIKIDASREGTDAHAGRPTEESVRRRFSTSVGSAQ